MAHTKPIVKYSPSKYFCGGWCKCNQHQYPLRPMKSPSAPVPLFFKQMIVRNIVMHMYVIVAK